MFQQKDINMKDHKNYDVGVIVGRFQVPNLHDGHRQLINFVTERHSKVLIVLGMIEASNSTNNPLDFEARRQMIQEEYPNITVLYVKDVPDDFIWSTNLDGVISDFVSPTQTVMLYGSRDSFIDAYEGRFDTFELMQENHMSGTAIRNHVRNTCRPNDDFRAGVIWAVANRYPTVYTCVDVAIFNHDWTKIALGRKKNEKKWRLIGGFSDPASENFELDAYREVREETGLSIGRLQYLGSFTIDDWRYRKEPDSVKTILFAGQAGAGLGKAADDIEELEWFDIDYLFENIDRMIMDNHTELFIRAFTYALEKRNEKYNA